MKKISILALGVVALMASCKKSDSNPSCEVSVAGIAGNYKISKVELVAAGISSDITSQSLDACQRDDIYQLKSDKTVVYQDAGTTCGSAGTGTWNVVNGKLTISHTGTGNEIDGASVTNNCSSLIADESAGSGTIRTTFVKQ
jgi:hypothetical protein